jgi:hypothetical protein
MVVPHRWLVLALVALAVTTTTLSGASAQPIMAEAGRAIQDAYNLSARIACYHRGPGRWTGTTPPPPGYCDTMRAGEMVVKELAHLASKALLYRQPGLVLRLQAAANRLSDELDEEEEINNAAEIPYQIFPCPVTPASYPARAIVIWAFERRMPRCRFEADTLALTFQARRSRMQQCLRPRP